MTTPPGRFEVDIAAIQRARDAFASGDWAQCFTTLNAFLKIRNRCGPDQWFEWAQHAIAQKMVWYRERLVQEVLAMWAAGEFRDRAHYEKHLSDRAAAMFPDMETALYYLTQSGNSDACTEKLNGVPTNGAIIEWCTIAACALEQDVVDAVFDEHIWGDTKPPQVRSRWCSLCEAWKPEPPYPELGEFVCRDCATEPW